MHGPQIHGSRAVSKRKLEPLLNQMQIPPERGGPEYVLVWRDVVPMLVHGGEGGIRTLDGGLPPITP